MYDYVKGKVVNKGANYLVVEHQGMGYKVHSSLATYHQMKVGEEVTVYLHFFVKEDEHSFYGFSTPYEREVFVTILSVSGIGPKLALKILAEIEAGKLIATVLKEDVEALKNIKGLGAKTAGKMILELKNKINHLIDIKTPSTAPEGGASEIYNNTVEALKSLGYKDAEIKKVLERVFAEQPLTLEEAIKKTLQALSKI